jgi:NAD+ kinase
LAVAVTGEAQGLDEAQDVMSTPKRYERIAFVASTGEEAQTALAQLTALYGSCSPAEADVVVALGGDGLMLQTLHQHMHTGKPIYGMHRGTVGFLMNEFSTHDLQARLAASRETLIHPLKMRATDRHGAVHIHHAINEVALFRQIYQVARLRIIVDEHERMHELMADGILVATPAGSTAYNLSVQGPILPINAALLALTPISAFRPRRWRGALLPDSAYVVIEVLEAEKRPVAAVADHDEVRDVRRVEILSDKTISMRMLFDPGHSLEERILREQFGH